MQHFAEWLLNEVFDKPAPFHFTQSRSEWRATFKLDENVEYEVVFDRYPAVQQVWEVLFTPTRITLARMGVSYNDRYYAIDQESTERTLKIFATVLAAMREFIADHRDAVLRFTAYSTEASKVRLYTRLIRTQTAKFATHRGEAKGNTFWVVPRNMDDNAVNTLTNRIAATNSASPGHKAKFSKG